MANKLVEINLAEEILSIVRLPRESHNLFEVERDLEEKGVTYDPYELESALMELIKDDRIILHPYQLPWHPSKDDKDVTLYAITIRTL